MTISPGMLFFTPQIGAGKGAAPGLLGQTQALTGGNGIFSTPEGMEFFNLLFATPANGEPKIEGAKSDSDLSILSLLLTHKTVNSPGETPAGETASVDTLAMDGSTLLLDPLSADVTGLNETPDAPDLPLTLADLSIASDPAARQTETDTGVFSGAEVVALPALSASSSDTLPAQNGQKLALGKFFAFLQHLLAGIPAENRPQVFNIASSKSGKGANPLQFTPPSDPGTETPDTTGTPATDTSTDTAQTPPALIATGLTPEDITKFLDELMKRAQAGESFVVGLVKLLPPQAKNEAIFFPRALILPAAPQTSTPPVNNTGDAATPPPGDNPAADMASALNALTVGDEDTQTDSSGEKAATGFDKILKVLESAQQPRPAAAPLSNNDAAPVPQAATGNEKPPVSPGLSTITGHTLPVLGMEFASATSSDIYPDGLDWAQSSSTSAAPGLTVSGPGPMTSLINHATQATQPHPAVQVIAATITKVAGDGLGKNFTLKLEPPELGRVEIRMEFSKDKSLKTHMLVEKQETYLMLQRDAQVLQRALQDAGIDINGGMSFELAQDGGMFGQNNNGDGGSNDSGGGSTADGDDNIEIIESTMTWTVDGAGQTHYDIWA